MTKERFKLTKKIIGLCLLVFLTGCQSPANINQEQEVNETKEKFIERKEITSQLTNSDIYNINSYLGDLNSSGFRTYDKENPDHDQLLNLGFWLYVYDGMDKVEYEEVNGLYYDVFPYEEFNEKINRYLDCELEKKGNEEWLFQDDKYYHPSLATGYSRGTVTQVDRVFDNGDGSFLVEGSVYRFEPSMEYNIYEQYLQPKSTWTTSMESELIATVAATIVYSEQLEHYVIDEYTSNYFNTYTEVSNDDTVSNDVVKEDETEEVINYLTIISESAGEELRQLVIALMEGDYDTLNQLPLTIKENSIPYYTKLRGTADNQTLISTIDLYLTLLEEMARPDYEYRFTLSNQYDRDYFMQMLGKATQIIEIYEEVSGDTYGIGRSQVDLIYREYPELFN